MKEYLNLVEVGNDKLIVTAFTIVVVLMFIGFLIVFLVLDYKNMKALEFRKKLYNKISRHEKYEVTTVYSDKSKNYSGTEILPVPTKEPTQQYNYEFIGWDKNNFNESGDIVAKPIYYKRLNKFVVNFYLDDKTTLLKTVEVKYGKSADASGLTPTKAETDEFCFEFDGWDKDISCVTEDESVYAVFKATPKKCHYKFVDSDGRVLFEEIAVFGTPIVYNEKPISKDENKVFSHFENYAVGQKLEKNETFTAIYKPVESGDELEKGNLTENNSENLSQDKVNKEIEMTFEDNQILSENEDVLSNENITESSDKNSDDLQEKTANLEENSSNSAEKQENSTKNAENTKNSYEINNDSFGSKIEKEEDSYFRKNYNSNFTFFDTGFDENEDDEVFEEIGASSPSYIQKSNNTELKNNEIKVENVSSNKSLNENHLETNVSKSDNDRGHLFNVNFASKPAGAVSGGEMSSNSNKFGGLSGVSANLNVDGHSKQSQNKADNRNSKPNFRFGQFGGLANVTINNENVKKGNNVSSNQNVTSNRNTIRKVKDGVTIEINLGKQLEQTEQNAQEKKSMAGFEKLRNSNLNSQKVVYSNINRLVNDSQKQEENSAKNNNQVHSSKNFNNGTRLNNFSNLYIENEVQKTQNASKLVQNQAQKPQKPHGTFTIFTGDELNDEKKKTEEKPVSFGANATMRKNYFTDKKITSAGFKNDKFENKTNKKDNVSNYFESLNRTESKQSLATDSNNAKFSETEASVKEESDEGSKLPKISVVGTKLKTEQARQNTLKNQNAQSTIENSKEDEDLLFGTILINHKKKK